MKILKDIINHGLACGADEVQVSKEIANTKLQIARENKNKYDQKDSEKE